MIRFPTFRIMSFAMCVGITLSACNGSTPQQDSTSHQEAENDVSENNNHVQGMKLRDVAGQATIQTSNVIIPDIKQMSKKELQLAGRYHVQISCKDPFPKCDSGSAEFIINLLPDGTAYRTFVYFGRVSNEISGSESPIVNDSVNHQDTWEYDPANNEIIIHRAYNVDFYYDVIDENTIQMKLEKILHGKEENIAYFEAGNPAPSKAYKFEKYDDH